MYENFCCFVLVFMHSTVRINSPDYFQKRKPKRQLLSVVPLNIALIPTVSFAVSFWEGHELS